MAVKTYSLAKDGNTKLSENFTVREFRCKDGSDTILIDTNLVTLLQEIRDAFGKPITINSAYRNAAYNASVGGASGSQHVKGTAADIVISGIPPYAVAAWMEAKIKKVRKYACGYYPISLFCHVDVRSTATLFLEYSKSKTQSVSTFGFGTKYEQYLAADADDEEDENTADAEEEDEVTQDQFNSMMETYLSARAKEEPGSWSADTRDWAESNGIVTGDSDGMRYKSFITREEAVTMIKRAVEL